MSLDGNSLREIKKFDQEKKKLSHSIYHTLKRYDLSIHYERERIFWVRSSESVIESASIGEFYKRSKIFKASSTIVEEHLKVSATCKDYNFCVNVFYRE